MRIYLDVCSLSRLTDDQSQSRIREEAAAVERILALVGDGHIQWVASDALTAEVEKNPDLERRLGNIALIAFASEVVEEDEQIAKRAEALHRLGYGFFDALHLAYAEAAHVQALLTTDDDFIRRASREIGKPRVVVWNPLSWSQEILP